MTGSPPSPAPSWRIDAYKYNGQLHYTLPARFVADDGERLHLYVPTGTFMRHLTRGAEWTITRPSAMHFWRERWYNVYANYDEAHAFNHFYCNVGLPPEIEPGRVAFVDLDLDVRIWPDGRYEVLDEDEFAAHSAAFNYPDAVQQAARQAVQDVLDLWQRRVPPFA